MTNQLLIISSTGGPHHVAAGSLTAKNDAPSPTVTGSPSHDGHDINCAGNPPPVKPTKHVPDFDPNAKATKLVWKVKRLALCDPICKHSSKEVSKDFRMSGSHARVRRRSGGPGDHIKLTFRLSPYGLGKDTGSFMSMKVCVHVDEKASQLREMAVLHLRITTKLPPTEFITVRDASNSLEDFVINDFIPHDIIINHGSKSVEFMIEAYLTHDRGNMSAADEQLMNSCTVIDDDVVDNPEQFALVAVGSEN